MTTVPWFDAWQIARLERRLHDAQTRAEAGELVALVQADLTRLRIAAVRDHLENGHRPEFT